MSDADLALPHVGPRAARFHALVDGFIARLPFGFDELVAPTVVGFVLINGSTFCLDLGLLTLMHGALGWPLAVAYTLAYASAFAVSFFLNRWLNFRSHASVGGQLPIYVVAVIVNYLAFILGVATGLSALGLEYHVSRILAGLCEGVFMYSVLRWVVFRSSR